MKAVLIGSDFLLDDNGNAKLVEFNTSAGVFQSMVPHLDFTELENLLQTNSIAELVYIFNDQQVVVDPSFRANLPISIGSKLELICETLGIAYTPYQVNTYATTVPYIEDTPTKFILRQAFDSTALIDDEYCADKANLQDLIKTESYAIPTYINNPGIEVDTLNTFAANKAPNIVVKSRIPQYDAKVFPEVHTISSQEDLDSLKENITHPNFVQEFVNSTNNVKQGRYSIIRSLDLVYGANLNTLHLGSYHQSTPYALDIWPDEFQTNSTALTNKSRLKWISKLTTDMQNNVYHVDEETKIITATGTYITINDVEEGTVVKSANFSNFPTGSYVDVFAYSSSFEEMQNSLEVNTATVVGFKSSSLETVYLNVTLENGINWDDSAKSTFYTEVSGSTVTRFKSLSQVEVGDKVILLDVATNELVKKEITALDPVYDTKIVYEMDVEEQDIFLSVLDETTNIALVQHNPCWCNGWNCGYWSCYNSCWTCQGGGCFIGEAVISTIDGDKEIKDIQIGEIVQSYDFSTNEIVTKAVKGIWKSDYDNKLVIINGIRTKATMSHPFAIKDFDGNISWAAADPDADKDFHKDLVVEKLEVGKYFINLEGNWVVVESIEFEDFKGLIYNIAVEDTHNYIAEGILVHNMAKKLE
jgi:hypothetical protein